MSKFPITERVCAGCGSDFLGRGRAKWCSDRCRKETCYSHPCIDCGAPLNGSDGLGPNAPRRCRKCASIVSGAARRIWTEEIMISRIREWAERHGDAPAFLDWMPSEVERRVRDGEAPAQALVRARRFREAHGYWPWGNNVARVFGSWNKAIEAAGFVPRANHGGAGNWRRRGTYLTKAAA